MSDYDSDDDYNYRYKYEDDNGEENKNNALHVAAQEGDLVLVQSLISNFDINAKGENGDTALLKAIQYGRIDIMKLLLSFNADVNIPNEYSTTALEYAASSVCPSTVRAEAIKVLLTASDINVNYANHLGDTALIVASRDGSTDVVKALLSVSDIDVNLASLSRNTALSSASKYGHVDVVNALLCKTQTNVNYANGDGNTALALASFYGHTEVIHALLAATDININYRNKHGDTALAQASENGHTEVLMALLAIPDINVNNANTRGFTPLFWASWNGHTEAIKVLLAVPTINVNYSNYLGETALLRASSSGLIEMLKVLLSAPGINVEHANNEGKTYFDVAKTEAIKDIIRPQWREEASFLEAVEAGDLVKVQLLINTIDVNCVANHGETATYKACKAGHVDIVQYLANQGADTNITDTKGYFPINVVAEAGHVEMLQVLAAHVTNLNKPLLLAAKKKNLDAVVVLLNVGADVSITDSNGKTCLDQFSSKDKLKILTMVRIDLSVLEAHDNALWFVIVQEDGTDDVDQLLMLKLLDIVEGLVSSHPTLASAKDADGRTAVDMASMPMKLRMLKVLLWHGRYRIIESRPEHISATCFVFKAVDEQVLDVETNQPIKVALKLMLLKTQFQREYTTRNKGFHHDYVMHILQNYPEVGSSTFDSWPDEVVDVEADVTGQLTKVKAEKLYLLVMPLADRNLFVALKQERWPGKNMEEVRHVFVQLVHCVEHMHEKGVLHGDLKTLNIVRTGGQWKLIDLDASCEIGKESVGQKFSSAYVPPEAIYVDDKTDFACVRSPVAVITGHANYHLLTAHPSFDVWSLGCILYQMCTTDVKSLFQGGQDDNLVGMRKGVDNLFSLAEWSPAFKADKLADIPDQLARNLLSQMLHKDPSHRPSLARVLAHPFLSGKKVARLVGEKPKYDVFLSYRVASDAHHVEKLYNLLTTQGFKVYWDKFCLLPGVDWEQGFCEGLVSSRAFVPLLSCDAINHPDKAWQNFSKLTTDSNCDNVFLEHRLAVELQGLGLIEKMFPVFIGNLDPATLEYTHYFGSGCHPALPDIAIKSVEEKLRHHMESQALGTPIVPNRTVKSVVGAITACQGAFIVGAADATFAAAADSITKMLTDVPVPLSPRGGTQVQQLLNNTMDINTLVAENNVLKTDVGTLMGKVDSLVNQREIALASLRSGQFTSIDDLTAHMETLLLG